MGLYQILYWSMAVNNLICAVICTSTLVYVRVNHKKLEVFDVAWDMMFQVLSLAIVGNLAQFLQLLTFGLWQLYMVSNLLACLSSLMLVSFTVFCFKQYERTAIVQYLSKRW